MCLAAIFICLFLFFLLSFIPVMKWRFFHHQFIKIQYCVDRVTASDPFILICQTYFSLSLCVCVSSSDSQWMRDEAGRLSDAFESNFTEWYCSMYMCGGYTCAASFVGLSQEEKEERERKNTTQQNKTHRSLDRSKWVDRGSPRRRATKKTENWNNKCIPTA